MHPTIRPQVADQIDPNQRLSAIKPLGLGLYQKGLIGMKISVRGGLPYPLSGPAISGPTDTVKTDCIALLGVDYPGMRARVLVDQGATVKAGTPLFEDRRNPGITVTAPVSGKIDQINIGAQRRLSSIHITVAGDDRLSFDVSKAHTNEGLRALMQSAGLWPALRARPFDRVPPLDGQAAAIFITATDTHAQAPNPRDVLSGLETSFARGVAALKLLTPGKIYLCQHSGDALAPADEQTQIVNVDGHHPAGLVGTHINRLHPPSRQKPVWHIGYQDVAELGILLTDGHLTGQRTITLSGPGLSTARYLRVRWGADLHALTRKDLQPGRKRILSGPALGGRENRHLSRYHLQATVLDMPPERPRNWLVAALRAAAVPAPFVPTQAVENALGPKLHVVPLLRALSIGDAESAARLGCLQLAEEDMALATYATGGEVDFAARLRDVLTTLEAS